MTALQSGHVDKITGQIDDLNIQVSNTDLTEASSSADGKRKRSNEQVDGPSKKAPKKIVPKRLEEIFKSLRKDLEKAGRYKQHLEYLNQYLAKNKTPKGLTCQIKPSFGKNDADFVQKWNKAASEVSLKFLQLSIDKLTQECEALLIKAQAAQEQLYTSAENQEEGDSILTFVTTLVSRRLEALKKQKQAKLDADIQGRKRTRPGKKWRNPNSKPNKAKLGNFRDLLAAANKFFG